MEGLDELSGKAGFKRLHEQAITGQKGNGFIDHYRFQFATRVLGRGMRGRGGEVS